MNIRERKFARYYVLDPETKGNAYTSAIKAGFSERYAIGNSYKLVERNGIFEFISKLEQEEKERLHLTKDKKLAILEGMYADKEATKAFALKVLREHGELAGDYVQKVESKDTTDYTEDEGNEITAIRGRLGANSEN